LIYIPSWKRQTNGTVLTPSTMTPSASRRLFTATRPHNDNPFHAGEGCKRAVQETEPSAKQPDQTLSLPPTLKHCANQLSPVFTGIFHTSLDTCHVPACFKPSTTIPVRKKPRITGTSVVMKSFERLQALTDPLLKPLLPLPRTRADRSVSLAVLRR